MSDVLLSQSLMQNNEESKITRDPFQQAQNQFSSKKDILSSSPVGNPMASLNEAPQAPDLNSMFSKIGLDGKNLAMNNLGRFQLIGRLRDKYGDQFMQNQDAIEVLKAFDENIKSQPENSAKSLNQGLTNANRTLGALFGGNFGV